MRLHWCGVKQPGVSPYRAMASPHPLATAAPFAVVLFPKAKGKSW